MTTQPEPTTALHVRHRPAGIEHPYATSADQRVPVRPAVGEPVRLGIEVDGTADAVLCDWQVTDPAGTVLDERVLTMTAGAATPEDAAALAGGDGHLAAAQAAQLASEGAWHTTAPALGPDQRARYRFRATGPDGTVASTDWFTVSGGRWLAGGGVLTVDGAPAEQHPLVVPGSTAWYTDLDGTHRVRFDLRLRPDEHVVGFGERYDAVDQRGRALDAVVFEQYKSQGKWGRTYLPMPFAHVLGEDGRPGWGFHLRTSRRTWYDVGAAEPGTLRVEAALGADGPAALDVGIYQGSSDQVLDAFLAEVGRPEELPDWVLRLWASGNEWNTQDLVMERMDRHAAEDVPVGVVVVEAWSDEEGITIWRDARYRVNADGSAHDAADFDYPADGAWPDPVGMIDELHRRGIKVVLWQIPLLKTRFDLGPDVPEDAQVLADGRAMIAGDHAVREADGSPYHNRGWWFPQALMPDLSTRRTRDWWTAKRRYLVEDLDVDGFKTDGGEHAWGADLRYGDGRRGDEGNNLYPVHYARAFGDLLRSAGKAPVTFSRAGFTGSQAHGVFWAGDEDSTWEAFRSSVVAGITAGACGIVYWGWDLAGFSGPVPDPELYARAVAASTFMPVMQYHSEFHHHEPPLRDRTPWNVAESTGDHTVVPLFRRFAHLRERLQPYLAEQARRAVQTSRPLMRGLFFDHPQDPEVWRWETQFQLGDDLVVSPVLEAGAERWTTYLPAGDWVDVWTGEAVAGGGEVSRAVGRDVVPVYCRAVAWSGLAEVFAPEAFAAAAGPVGQG